MTFQDAGRRIFRAIKWTAKWLFIAWVAMFIAFLPYRLWETYKLKAMCEDIKPGLPVSEVRDLGQTQMAPHKQSGQQPQGGSHRQIRSQQEVNPPVIQTRRWCGVPARRAKPGKSTW